MSNPEIGDVKSIAEKDVGESAATDPTCNVSAVHEDQFLSEKEVVSDINDYIDGITKTSGD